MSATTSANVEEITGHELLSENVPDTDDNREKDAHTTRFVVIPYVDEYGYTTGEYLVFSESGSTYDVDVKSRGNECPCPDASFNNPEGGCKHLRRVMKLIGRFLPEPDEPAEEFLHRFVDAEDALQERKNAIESGDAEGENEEEAEFINRTLKAINYIKSEMSFEPETGW